ncbi:hypothetical protein Gpo141_00014979, partial [Globisporangium polare]
MDAKAEATALAVLTDPTLWRNITPFMSGWPFPVFRLWKQRVPKYTLHDTSWSSRDKFPQRSGATLHIAIAENDLRVVELAYELQKTPQNRKNPLLSMGHVLACAAHYGRLEMLQWMVEAANKESEWIDYHTLKQAAVEDDLELIKWVYDRDYDFWSVGER